MEFSWRQAEGLKTKKFGEKRITFEAVCVPQNKADFNRGLRELRIRWQRN